MSYSTNDTYNEFIELFNCGSSSVDLSGWMFSDGDGIDFIVAWDPLVNGFIGDGDAGGDADVVYNNVLLSSGCYAVILDKDYADGDEPYNFPAQTIILTVTNSTLGGSGLARNDPITLYNNNGNMVSSYGTPVITSSDTYNNADDDFADLIPLSTNKGFSAEMINAEKGDIESNWMESVKDNGCSPGARNSVSDADIPDPVNRGAFVGLITEVMPDNSDNDWIELFVLKSSGSICGYKLYEGKTLVKEFPSVIPDEYDYIIVHFNSMETDEIISKGENNFWDFYTSNEGLTATDNSIIVRDRNNNIIDFLSYANNDFTWSVSNKSLFEEAKACEQWTADETNESHCAEWDKSPLKSLTRIGDQFLFLPKDTNTKNDWIINEPSQGTGYIINNDDEDTNIDSNQINPEVTQTPFCPYGGFKYSASKIIFYNPESSVTRVKIYDVQGRMIRLLEETDMQCIKEIMWDGTDS
ncbi:lamin tail domain-containing protein, partial [bacterium]